MSRALIAERCDAPANQNNPSTGQRPFDERMLEILNGGALCLMISLGHRTGLFDVMATLPRATSAQIAKAARRDERYVREWLGALAAGGIVEHDGLARTYWLPAERAALLTRASQPNLAVAAQFIPLLGGIEEDILRCFREGGGVPYSRYARFHEVMAEESGQTVVAGLKDHILPLVPGLTERLEAGITVLDAGCGRGRALIEMAATYPNSRFVGYDLSEEAIAFARADATTRGLANIVFEARDLRSFDQEAEAARFDLVTTFDAIHDQADPAAMLRGIRIALARGGVYLAQDIRGSSHLERNLAHPIGALLYTVSCLHCMTVSLAQGGAGLGAMWGRELAMEMLEAAGFGTVEVHELPHDIQNYYYVCTA